MILKFDQPLSRAAHPTGRLDSAVSGISSAAGFSLVRYGRSDPSLWASRRRH